MGKNHLHSTWLEKQIIEPTKSPRCNLISKGHPGQIRSLLCLTGYKTGPGVLNYPCDFLNPCVIRRMFYFDCMDCCNIYFQICWLNRRLSFSCKLVLFVCLFCYVMFSLHKKMDQNNTQQRHNIKEMLQYLNVNKTNTLWETSTLNTDTKLKKVIEWTSKTGRSLFSQWEHCLHITSMKLRRMRSALHKKMKKKKKTCNNNNQGLLLSLQF